MNRFRYLGIGITLLVALAASAQQTAASQVALSPIDQHLKMLTERLDLTADQQVKLRPILKEFLDGRQKLINDQSLSEEERHEKIKALHAKADKQARTICTDDQKKKLDELEQQMHH